MEQEDLIFALKSGRADFLELLKGLADQQMEILGVVENWSIKDILIHLTRWEAEIIKLIWQAKQGITPTTAHFSGKTVDDINNLWYEESQSRGMKIVMDDFHGVRKQTIRQVEELPDSALNNPEQYAWLKEKPLWEWIAADSFEHEAEHAEQIKTWLRGQS